MATRLKTPRTAKINNMVTDSLAALVACAEIVPHPATIVKPDDWRLGRGGTGVGAGRAMAVQRIRRVAADWGGREFLARVRPRPRGFATASSLLHRRQEPLKLPISVSQSYQPGGEVERVGASHSCRD